MDINILLVDDEAVDLEWLRRRVAGSGIPYPLRVVGTANSGFGALKILEQERADLILSDIRMPIMSGTEFARRAREIHPQVKIVFISGHEDFGYAKKAIELNASGYLLKPVEDNELKEMLLSLCESVEREREQKRTASAAWSLVGEELLIRWLKDFAAAKAGKHIQDVLHPLLRFGTAAALVEIDDLEWKTGEWTGREKREQIQRLLMFIRSYVEENMLGTFFRNEETRYLILSSVSEHEFPVLLEGLIAAVRDSSPFTVTAGIGKFARDEESLRESYRQAQAALSVKWLLGKDRLISWDVVEWAPGGHVPVPSVDEVLNRMLRAILEYDLVAVDDCLAEIFDRRQPLFRKNEVYDLILRITTKLHADLRQMGESLYELLKWDANQPVILFQFETVHDIKSWLRKRFFELSELLYVKKQRHKRKLIEEIMQYVDSHLERKITLKEVATHFDFTPNYLGFLFKEETGQHFSDYLNERRTKRVCELLSDPTLKIYEIAERMGYKNIVYFNRQFKQTMAMTPGEYRKKNKI
ncbi:response regulator [Paenibacillus sp. M1]|uniref:Response regulator n=1 Tax=Paenibacillus haidiansis TaxID=1574488 RepID=A0ABU7VUS3_9BACL